jgi:hypothetical protein
LLKVLEKLDPKKMTQEARAKQQGMLDYLRQNLHRMDYPEYLRRGWQIATGAVESACKTVVNQRLCLGGMRWGEEGSDAVAHLRALYRSDSDKWDAYWGNAAYEISGNITDLIVDATAALRDAWRGFRRPLPRTKSCGP